ncbi:hypothetical protein IAQ61_011335, partial [Plenodomus lingam]|uniref:uncharacterized protein n=1 Tax=Leptosphaeria maculans TaxID=5022 RepID=UPI0033338169
VRRVGSEVRRQQEHEEYDALPQVAGRGPLQPRNEEMGLLTNSEPKDGVGIGKDQEYRLIQVLSPPAPPSAMTNVAYQNSSSSVLNDGRMTRPSDETDSDWLARYLLSAPRRQNPAKPSYSQCSTVSAYSECSECSTVSAYSECSECSAVHGAAFAVASYRVERLPWTEGLVTGHRGRCSYCTATVLYSHPFPPFFPQLIGDPAQYQSGQSRKGPKGERGEAVRFPRRRARPHPLFVHAPGGRQRQRTGLGSGNKKKERIRHGKERWQSGLWVPALGVGWEGVRRREPQGDLVSRRHGSFCLLLHHPTETVRRRLLA